MTTYLGTSSSNSIVAVEGDNTGGGTGIKGLATLAGGSGVVAQITATSGGGQALYANSSSPGANAIFAEGINKGVQTNVYATSNAIAIHGWASNSGSSASNNIGILGEGDTCGLQGNSTNGYGVYGNSNFVGVLGSGQKGVYGESSINNGFGVYGFVTGIAGYAGYFAGSNQWNTFGVYCIGSGTGYALYASGNATVTGYLTKSGGGYQVDHPADPENKILNHCFVESPEMMNVYRGRVVCDNNGNATVTMPLYFDAANELVEYNLAPVGAAMPNLHVSEEMKSGTFGLAGGVAGKSVSWQITAARADKWAKANHPGVEITKKEPGFFMHPKLFGFGDDKNMDKEMRNPRVPAPKNP